jgi:eukaryotic-like serine/threonine-protein kinase
VILAGSPPVAKLLDFGVAKVIDAGTRLTVSGIKVGTPASMAPEQIAGGPISPATDVYALAVLVFRMLVGRYPFEAANAVEMQDRHLRAAPAVPGSFDPALRPFDAVLLRALEKDPARRHPSVGALVADLRAVAAHPGGSRLRSETVPGVGLRVLGPAPSVRAACEAAGLAVCVDTAEVLVAVAALPPGEAGRELRARVLDLALAVGGEAMVHAAPVVRLMVDERTQYAGGPLLALEEWTPVAGGGAVATAAAVEGLEDRYALEGSQIYRVLGRRE